MQAAHQRQHHRVSRIPTVYRLVVFPVYGLFSMTLTLNPSETLTLNPLNGERLQQQSSLMKGKQL